MLKRTWILVFLMIFFMKQYLSSQVDPQQIANQFLQVKPEDIDAGFNRILAHFKSNGQEVSIVINDTQTEESDSEEYKKLDLELEEAMEMSRIGRFTQAFQKLEMNKDKALELRHSRLLYVLGEVYLYGEGTKRDEKKAFEILSESAKIGNAKAQREIGLMYATGRGVQKNMALSLLYYTFAASAGDIQAAMALGFKYKEGIGVEKSCGKGLFFYKYVASQVIKRLEETMIEDKIKITNIAKDVRSIVTSNDNEIEEDNDELLQLYIYNAKNGDTKSQIAMGNLYLKGSNKVKRDFKKAFKYYSMAKEKASAKGMLGFLYKNGYGVERDNATALKYMEEGANMNDGYSLVSLGRSYLKGELGLQKDYTKAVHYFSEGAKKGHALAHYYLGECHLHGTGADKDLNKAHQFYQISASQITFSAYKLALVQLMQIHDPIHACENTIGTFKEIAEKGAVRKLFEVAQFHYEKEEESFPSEEESSSSLYYEKLAEMGFETAQLNSAWIFHNFLHNSEKALKYYKYSAVQNNALSHLQIGNYFYYGYFRDQNGVVAKDKQITPNMKKAFKSYQIAASFNEPEALYNLGWMHQEGLGSSKDKHLAKRYYDLSLVYLPSGLWAVRISVIYLQILDFIEVYKDYEMFGYKWDSWLIVFLLFILSTLILFKKMIQRIQVHQQNQNNQQQN